MCVRACMPGVYVQLGEVWRSLCSGALKTTDLWPILPSPFHTTKNNFFLSSLLDQAPFFRVGVLYLYDQGVVMEEGENRCGAVRWDRNSFGNSKATEQSAFITQIKVYLLQEPGWAKVSSVCACVPVQLQGI